MPYLSNLSRVERRPTQRHDRIGTSAAAGDWASSKPKTTTPKQRPRIIRRQYRTEKGTSKCYEYRKAGVAGCYGKITGSYILERISTTKYGEPPTLMDKFYNNSQHHFPSTSIEIASEENPGRHDSSQKQKARSCIEVTSPDYE